MGQRDGCSRNDFRSLISERVEGHYDSSSSSSVQQLTLGDRGRGGAGVLGGNAIVAQCGKFGFEWGVLIQDD